MTPFWFWAIVALCALAAVINFILAYARRKHPTVALMRGAAGAVSLLVAVGIILGKVIAIAHPYLTRENVFIGVGVFIALVFFLPSYYREERRRGAEGDDPAARGAPGQRDGPPARRRRAGGVDELSTPHG